MEWDLVYPFIAQLVFLTAFLHLLLPEAARSKAVYSSLVLLSSLILLMLPINGLPGFYYLRAYTGDLSITSLVFFGAYIVRKGFGIPIYRASEAIRLQTLVVLLGLFLYPFALGIGPLDTYRLGFHPQALTVALFVCAIYFWHKSYYFLLFVVTSVVLGYLLGLLESNNLWDYLLDAILWLVCSAKILLSGFRALTRTLRT